MGAYAQGRGAHIYGTPVHSLQIVVDFRICNIFTVYSIYTLPIFRLAPLPFHVTLVFITTYAPIKNNYLKKFNYKTIKKHYYIYNRKHITYIY